MKEFLSRTVNLFIDSWLRNEMKSVDMVKKTGRQLCKLD